MVCMLQGWGREFIVWCFKEKQPLFALLEPTNPSKHCPFKIHAPPNFAVLLSNWIMCIKMHLLAENVHKSYIWGLLMWLWKHCSPKFRFDCPHSSPSIFPQLQVATSIRTTILKHEKSERLNFHWEDCKSWMWSWQYVTERPIFSWQEMVRNSPNGFEITVHHQLNMLCGSCRHGYFVVLHS